MKELSIVIPVFNEEQNIQPLVERIKNSLYSKTFLIKYEIIFIDDNSTDNTKKVILNLSKKYPIKFFLKKGNKGKAFSLQEGFSYTLYENIAMIDADLQYPPEAIVQMLKILDKGADIVVANRISTETFFNRKLTSKVFRFIFGKLLFGLNHDVQAGLKLFKKEILNTINIKPSSGWTYDLELLHKAKNLGFKIINYDVPFEKRKKGKSKVSLFKTSFEIGSNAFFLRLRSIEPVRIKSIIKGSTIGAGIRHRGRKYITHTSLHYSQSALQTFILKQKIIIATVILLFLFGIFTHPILTLQILVGILSLIYFVDACFNLYLILKSLHFPQEITFSKEELENLKDSELPIYSILCPLYKEAHIIPIFFDAINKLNYPKEKLDVILLLEEDDKESILKVKKMKLPFFVKTIIVPNSMPKTKPKACNYGLSYAKGEYLVIYDAEDIPDPLQLKKAYLGFKKVKSNIVCLQAKLNYYNPHQNLLTRFFTAEYSLWFDVILTGLQAANTGIPLGGTSNHFRIKDLRLLEGWDPFNVTEDADLGIRLFKKGFQTAIIDSVTLEEANSKILNWIRQRSRWIKGYMQTYLVHTRESFRLKNKNLYHSLLFHLNIGGKIAFILINPFLWIATISYFALYKIVGPTIESLYPSYIFYMAASSLVAGNFLFLYYYMIGCAKRNQWSLIKYVYLVPLYWLLISWAGFIALYQLIFKPHYWEKTIHGLHLNKKNKKIIAEIIIDTEENIFPNYSKRAKNIFLKLIKTKKIYLSGALLIFATVASNFLNFAFNAYLGRVIHFESFAMVSLISTLLYLSSIPFGALSSTVNYRSGYLHGKNNNDAASAFWFHIRKHSFFLSVIMFALWIICAPLLSIYFKTSSILPFILFAPVWIAGIVGAVDKGYFLGRLLFGSYAIIMLSESILRIIIAYTLVRFNLGSISYIAIPFAFFASFLIGWYIVLKKSGNFSKNLKVSVAFPKKFFLISIISGLSIMTFLSLDVVLAKHYLSSREAGQYALLSLVGKMIFFLSSFATQFIVPLVSKKEGEHANSSNIFYTIFLATFILTIAGLIVFGVFGNITIPFLLGPRAEAITPYLIIFASAVTAFSLSRVIISYYLTRKIYAFPILGFLIAIMQVVLIALYHKSIMQISIDMLIVGLASFSISIILHGLIRYVIIFERNVYDLISLFLNGYHQENNGNVRILIFNWRDVKHKWAGGAEVYLHELAKRWVMKGSQVSIFCGNDGNHPRNETIDGIQIIRRGGFYTVYLWAFLYYIFKFRGLYDVVIDSENGIPFFTPIYVKKPIFLLIHHVHQEVFRKSLKKPFVWLAEFLELKVMPLVYKNIQVITVSPSSKDEILKHKLTKKEPIIIYNGVDLIQFKPGIKNNRPLILHIGRLQYYKSINVFIKAIKKVLEHSSNVDIVIAGEGEEKKKLQQYTKKLGMENTIKFLGKVTHEEKIKLYQKAWVFVNPSFMEGWGITTIEANACGTPAIASNVPGLKDSIKNSSTGYLVLYGDYEKFAEKILELIKNNKIRKQFSNEAVQWAHNFSWERSAEVFDKIIQKSLLI